MKRIIWATALMTVLWGTADRSRGQERTPGPLTIDALIDIKHPSSPQWSPDGRHVAFTWERAGVTSLYVADSDGQSPPREVSQEVGAGAVTWSRDARSLYISRGRSVARADRRNRAERGLDDATNGNGHCALG